MCSRRSGGSCWKRSYAFCNSCRRASGRPPAIATTPVRAGPALRGAPAVCYRPRVMGDSVTLAREGAIESLEQTTIAMINVDRGSDPDDA